MSEEILKVQLGELLNTVRLKRENGTFIEASDIEGVRDCCLEVRNGNPHLGQKLMNFFNLAAELADETQPVQVEFAIKLK